MNITKFSINHFMAVLVMSVGILLAGGSFYGDMPRENMPDVKIPFVIVTTSMTGANPTDIEISITTPLETTLEGIEGLKKLNSTSSEGVSVISLEFDPSLETEVVLSRVRDAVDKGKGDLPSDVDAPIVKEFSLSGEVPVVVLSLVSGKNISLSQLQEMGDSIGDELERLPGVLDVKVRGGRDRMILIEVDPERMRYFKITLGQIQQMLTSTNRNVSAGASEGTINRIVMRAPGEFQTTEEIFNLVIGTSSRGTPVYMRDIATVSYSFENERSRARHYKFTTKDGETPINQYVPPEKSISIEIMKKSGDNLLALTEAVKKTIADLNLPKDVNIIVSLDQSKEVKMMLSDLENGIGTSLILVLMVIFVGLGARNAILVAVAIPFSMFLSIIILSALGFTLNMMVLYSLIMALGMLVDNAIVIVENIYRHYCLGETRIKAALTGTTEVAWPVIASTATTVGAFLPLVFWPGIMGSFMGFLPKTVIIVLLSSLFVALVINPTLCSLLMRRGKGAKSVAESDSERPTYPLVVFYARFLKHMLDRPIWTISTAGLILVFSIVLYGTFGAGVEFFPTLDPGSINANIKPPEGVSLDESDRMSKQMEDRIFGKPGSGYNTPVKNIKNVSVTIPLGVGPIKTRIQFVDRDYREGKTTASVSEIRNRIEGLDADGKQVTFPLYDAEYDVVTPSDGPSSGKPISVDIYGQDLNQMTHVIRDMKQFMTKTEGVAKPTDNAATAQPTLEWKIDRARAGMFGLNQSTVSSYLKLAVGGVRSGSFGHGDDEQDILFRVPQIPTQSATQLKNITIPTPGGGSIPITSIASATLVPGPVAIKHGERQRVLNAGAELQPWVKADADVRASFQKKVKQYSFPPGITYSFGGAAEDQQESTEFLQFAFITALFLMAIVLVIQFNSIFVPMIIFASIILSLVGVFAGLLIFDMPFGIIMSGIGVISLAGVVVNNAIVLLDAIRQMQNKGHELYDAVITAGMIRFRPVLLTAITTILGLAPMAFKINIDFANLTYQYDTDSSQYWQSMAVAIIFGLFLSTILTLGVVPTLYVIYDRSKSWISGKWPGENSEDLMQKAR
ncbi:MAG: efflux RND transporter permease subunit [Proteobacteria bacterium]|nr:efflux RND transporter permease subunit [Pseudomonadota bacterium]